MGEVIDLVELEPARIVGPPTAPSSSDCLSTQSVLSEREVRRINRDIRHLDAMAARLRDYQTVARIIARYITLVRPDEAETAARRIGLYVSTGRQ